MANKVAGKAANKDSDAAFTEEGFPRTVARLLELNNYKVRHDVHINGAQVDLIAESMSDPFAPPLYVEVTVEYVSTEKYGKVGYARDNIFKPRLRFATLEELNGWLEAECERRAR